MSRPGSSPTTSRAGASRTRPSGPCIDPDDCRGNDRGNTPAVIVPRGEVVAHAGTIALGLASGAPASRPSDEVTDLELLDGRNCLAGSVAAVPVGPVLTKGGTGRVDRSGSVRAGGSGAGDMSGVHGSGSVRRDGERAGGDLPDLDPVRRRRPVVVQGSATGSRPLPEASVDRVALVHRARGATGSRPPSRRQRLGSRVRGRCARPHRRGARSLDDVRSRGPRTRPPLDQRGERPQRRHRHSCRRARAGRGRGCRRCRP